MGILHDSIEGAKEAAVQQVKNGASFANEIFREDDGTTASRGSVTATPDDVTVNVNETRPSSS